MLIRLAATASGPRRQVHHRIRPVDRTVAVKEGNQLIYEVAYVAGWKRAAVCEYNTAMMIATHRDLDQDRWDRLLIVADKS